MRSFAKLFFVLAVSGLSPQLFAQDKIFKTDGDTLFGKVVEVWEGQIKFLKQDNLKGPYYVIRSRKVDSIVYESGKTDEIASLFYKRRESNHLKTNNTFSFDLTGMIHYSVTQWYERRVWKGKLGIRIPLYLCWQQNYSPGYRTIRKAKQYNYVENGFSFATGVNPKFYLNKHKIIRAFAGPEVDIGYSDGSHNYVTDIRNRPSPGIGNVQLAGLAGININPIARFNVAIEGGGGYTFAFAKSFNQHNPVWRVGLSFGANF